MSQPSPIPDIVPVLSRGKHRNPRRGACFMELASFLAGERWSDSPACTHALLAEVARNVNDQTSDAARPRLTTLIPSVVGLSSDDPRADARLALRCALLALPVAPFQRQRSLAVGVFGCVRQLQALDDPQAPALEQEAQLVLAGVPDAHAWARRFAGRSGLDRKKASQRHFHRYAGPGIVKLAAAGVAEASVPDVDDRLRALLEAAIAECLALSDIAEQIAIDEQRLHEAWTLTR